MKHLEIMPDALEVVHYDEPGIGLYIRRGVLSEFPDYRAECHWHGDLEFIHVLEGEMAYTVDGAEIRLRTGDILFVNARRLHYGSGPQHRECIFTCVLADPRQLTASERLERSLIRPLTEDETRPFAVFSRGRAGHDAVEAHMRTLWQLKQEGRRGYQLRALGELAELVLEIGETAPAVGPLPAEDERLPVLKGMMVYIVAHYAEDLTLDDIAASGAVSRSTCCRLFRAFVRQTPGQFLGDYRLREARERLARTDKTVTRIAAECGFNDAGYFSRQFRARFGCTPREYREQEKRKPG